MVELAWKLLLADRSKLCAGVLGVAFSLVLACVQGGLYLGLMRKASLLVDHARADLWVTHKLVENVDLAREIPESWGQRLRGIPGVQQVAPYIVGKGTASLSNGHMEDVWIIGADAHRQLGGPWNFVEGTADALRRPDAVSFDDVDASKLGHPQLGDLMEVNGQRTQIVARTHGITGFITMPYLFTTYNTGRKLAQTTPGATSFFLLKLSDDCNPQEVQEHVRQRLPNAAVYSPEEFAKISQDYWMKRTGIGISFGAATLLGLLVGLAVVGQSLYTLALNHLHDFAALKAMGGRDSDVCRIVLFQSLFIGLAGCAVGLAVIGLIRSLWMSPLAPIEIPSILALSSVGVMFVICFAASFAPYLQIRRVDPAVVLIG